MDRGRRHPAHRRSGLPHQHPQRPDWHLALDAGHRVLPTRHGEQAGIQGRAAPGGNGYRLSAHVRRVGDRQLPYALPGVRLRRAVHRPGAEHPRLHQRLHGLGQRRVRSLFRCVPEQHGASLYERGLVLYGLSGVRCGATERHGRGRHRRRRGEHGHSGGFRPGHSVLDPHRASRARSRDHAIGRPFPSRDHGYAARHVHARHGRLYQGHAYPVRRYRGGVRRAVRRLGHSQLRCTRHHRGHFEHHSYCGPVARRCAGGACGRVRQPVDRPGGACGHHHHPAGGVYVRLSEDHGVIG